MVEGSLLVHIIGFAASAFINTVKKRRRGEVCPITATFND